MIFILHVLSDKTDHVIDYQLISHEVQCFVNYTILSVTFHHNLISRNAVSDGLMEGH